METIINTIAAMVNNHAAIDRSFADGLWTKSNVCAPGLTSGFRFFAWF